MKLLKLVPDDTNVKFLKWRKLAFGLSIFFMIASVGLVATKGLNFGVDFIGGQMIRATFTQSAEAPVTELRDKVGALGYGDPLGEQRRGEGGQIEVVAAWHAAH